MPKKASVVFIQVKISALDNLATTLRKRSMELRDSASWAQAFQDETLEQERLAQACEIDQILGRVLQKQRLHR